MNYSPLVEAIREGDRKTANRMIAEATPILIRMLMSRMNAKREDAEDAVQKMFLYVIPAIRSGKIKKPTALLSYMILCCRHNYLKELRNMRHEPIEEHEHEIVNSSDPFEYLKLKDIRKIHIECVNSMAEQHREFYCFWLQNQDIEAAAIAERFGISVTNAWTRKHRILKKLRESMLSMLNS
ncbi:MAG: sigma-70 family RNA polymerase sigma factor [Balneolaceae bacterium]